MDNNKKINVDDISFDDMLDGGIEEVVETTEEPQIEKPIENVETAQTQTEETSLDDDVKAKQQEDSRQGQVLAEAEIPPAPETPTSEETSETTKEEESKEEVDDSVIGQVLSSLGYETEDKYEDTPEGLTKMAKDVGNQMAEEQLDVLFQKFPLVRDHLQYVMSGGDSQDFMAVNDPRGDYSRMRIQEKDVAGQKYILSEYFKTKGHDNKFINELLDDYQESGKLFAKAQNAQKSLATAQQQYKKQMLVQQQKAQQQQVQEQNKFWNGVYNTIDQSKEFQGIQIAEREKGKFFDYLSKPVTKEGYTQRDIDYSQAKMDVKLAMDYLMYKGFNLDKLIDKKARTKSTQSLKSRIKGHQETIKSARKASKAPSKAVDIEDLDLSLF